MPTKKQKPRRGRKERYPWAKWFSRAQVKAITLTRGKEFPCQVHGMAQMLRKAADRAHLRVSLSLQEGGKIVLEVL